MMNDKNYRWILLLGFALLVALSAWQTRHDQIAIVHKPTRIMGTDCIIAVLIPSHQRETAEKAINQTEQLIRDIEVKMSTWIEMSEISRFNRGEITTLSPPTHHVLQAAKRAYHETQGAFDITCRPLIELWREAGQNKDYPSIEKLRVARRKSNWDLIDLTENGAIKHSRHARVDLGGIAKGYAIDKAVQCLKDFGITGGMVDIGGDLLCFREEDSSDYLLVKIQNPFGDDALTTLSISNRAVCTSGNYARYYTIEGKKYSHIIDPRSCQPADLIPSVTVLADDAITADIWATALSVLGKEGLKLLPPNVEAFLIQGDQQNHEMIATPGFQNYLAEDETLPIQEIDIQSKAL